MTSACVNKCVNKIIYCAQCQPEAESEALVWAARENWRPSRNSEL